MYESKKDTRECKKKKKKIEKDEHKKGLNNRRDVWSIDTTAALSKHIELYLFWISTPYFYFVSINCPVICPKLAGA